MGEMTENTSAKNRISLLLGGIIIVLLVILGYQYFSMQKTIEEKVEIGIERNDLLEDLTFMQSRYDSLSTESVDMQEKIKGQQQKIDSMLVEVKKHKGDAWTIRQLRKETESLRTIMKGYLYTIDSLNTLNIELKAENEQIQGKLNQERQKTRSLTQKSENLNQIIAKGSRLQALDLWAGTIKMRTNGTQVPTDRAKKAEKVKSCFTLSENTIAKKGNKNLFFRVISPEGKVLHDDLSLGKTFEYDGVSGLYTMIRTVDYKGAAMDVCIYWDIPTPLDPGFYIVEVYADEALIGRTSFDLL
jgi:hypothetical protein